MLLYCYKVGDPKVANVLKIDHLPKNKLISFLIPRFRNCIINNLCAKVVADTPPLYADISLFIRSCFNFRVRRYFNLYTFNFVEY